MFFDAHKPARGTVFHPRHVNYLIVDHTDHDTLEASAAAAAAMIRRATAAIFTAMVTAIPATLLATGKPRRCPQNA